MQNNPYICNKANPLNCRYLLLLPLFTICRTLFAQCPEITQTTVTPACAPSCEMCEGESFTVNLKGVDLPNGGKIEYYFNDVPDFNPYLGQGTKIGSANITTPGGNCRICPELIGFMIDACGTEQLNEFIVIWTGSGFNTSNLIFDFDANNNVGAGNGDIGTSCGIASGNAGLIGGCMATAVGAGFNLPGNAIWVVFTSAGTNYAYDFSSVCGLGLKVFVSSSACSRSIGGFSNFTSTGIRTQTFSVNGCACGNTIMYDTDDPSLMGNGDAWAGCITNGGCAASVSGAGNYVPAISVIDPFTYVIPKSWCDKTYEIVGIINPKPDPMCCMEEFTERFEITVKCPKAKQSALEACEFGNGLAIFNLEDADMDVLDGSSGTVEYFRDAAGTISITSPYTSATGTVYARVVDGRCKSSPVPIKLTVVQMPFARTASDTLCEELFGIATFPLIDLITIIKGSNPGAKVTFYEDLTLTTQIFPPYATTTITIYAVTSNGDCTSNPVPINLIVRPSPTSRKAGDTICDLGDGTGIFNLSKLDSVVSGGIKVDSVRYFEDSLTTVMIKSPYRTSSKTIYAIVYEKGCTSKLAEISLKVLKFNAVPLIIDKMCEDGNGNAEFDLINVVQILQNGNPSIKIEFFADSLAQKLIQPPLSISRKDTIYAYASKDACLSNLVQIILEPISRPKAFPVELVKCADSSGKAIFNLDDIRNLVNGGNGLFVGFSEDSLLKKLVRSPYVSADDTLYGFTLDGNCFSKPVLVVLKANPIPQFNHQNDTTACGYFILDQINGNRLSGNEVYSTGERGSGKIYKANDTLFQSEKIYLYDVNSGCEAEDSFNILLSTPVDAGQDYTGSVCQGNILDLNTLLAGATPGGIFIDRGNTNTLVGSNFNSTNQNGKTFNFTYLLSAQAPCPNDSSEIFIEVVNALSAGLDSSVTICENELLNLDSLRRNFNSGGIWRDTSTTGAFTNSIWNSSKSGPGMFEIIYETGDGKVCPKDFAAFSITVNPGIEIDPLTELINCSYYVLPVINGKNIPSDASYYTGPNGTGQKFNSGDTIRFSTNLFAYAKNQDACNDEKPVVVTIDPLPETNFTQSNLCAGDSLLIGGNVYNINRPKGREILKSVLQTNCDSIVNIDLSFRPVINTKISLNLCEGDFIVVNNTRYDQLHPKGREVLTAASSEGCDSIIDLELQYFKSPQTDYSVGICPGTRLTINGSVYDENRLEGIDTLIAAAQNGCDSLVHTKLVLLPVSSFVFRRNLCFGDFILINGIRFDQNNPGLKETLKAASFYGCDSTVDIQISFYPESVFDLQKTLCNGQSITVNGKTYNQSNPRGLELIKGAGQNGCDSTVRIDLTFRSEIKEIIRTDLCQGDTLKIGNRKYYDNNLVSLDTLFGGAQGGCDSIVDVQVNLINTPNGRLDTTLCIGESILINGTLYNESNRNGFEKIKVPNGTGCDSLVEISLNYQELKVDYIQVYQINSGEKVSFLVNPDFIPSQVQWFPSTGLTCSDCLNPVASPSISTDYTLVLTDENGCQISLSIKVIIQSDTDIFTPTGFSPNGDQVNDRFKIFGKNPNLTIEKLNIFDRWGELIYEENNVSIGSQIGWDGTFKGLPLNPGTFVFYLKIKESGRTIYGDINLVR
ncbi:MAG: gliding motility-associated C-terminal domain-containing protein [Saprospiraceae bacterium]|nr:gliding motility-associated C-terminal domain-containing protein [Candidatus Vicinibacter affinis]